MAERRPIRRVPGLRLTCFVAEDERVAGQAFWRALLGWAREAGVRAALATRGTAGFGHDRRVRTTRIEVLAFPLPVTVECVGEVAAVERLLERLEGVPLGGVVELQPTSLVVPESRTRSPGGREPCSSEGRPRSS